MIIDIHAHVFPDDVAGKALAKIAGNSGVPPKTDGTLAGLSASIREAGIDRAVNMPIATRPSQVRTINQWAAEINAAGGNVISFGTLHPMHEDWQGEIDRLVAARIPGIKLHPDYQDFFVDDESVIPMYRALADAGLIVLFHAGEDIGLPPPVHAAPERLARVLDAVPGLTIIAAHVGGWRLWDDVEKHLVGRDIFFDTAFSLQFMGSERMASIITAHGAQRVLFGTDSPWVSHSEALAEIRSLPVSDDDLAAVLGGNAERLLSGHL
jgi:uncharacterized protein